MADFFSTLVGRTLGVEVSPRPIIAPMFAPGPTITGEDVPDNAGIVAEDEAIEGGSSLLQLRSPALTWQGPALRSVMDDPLSPHLHNARRPTDPARLGETPLHTTRQSEPAVPGSLHSEPRSLSPLVRATSPLVSPPNQIRPRDSVPQEQSVSRSLDRRAARQGSTEPSPVIPTIRVSIGRVDVRAVIAPASPVAKRATPAIPQPSLEEYLQARNRGKR